MASGSDDKAKKYAGVNRSRATRSAQRAQARANPLPGIGSL